MAHLAGIYMKFRVGIIGCGVICENHIIPLIQNSNTELVAVCDIVKDKATSVANLYNCKAYFDYKDMLKMDISYNNACLMKKVSIDTGRNLGIIF